MILKLVRYRLESGDGTNVGGLLRTEEPLVLKRQAALTDDLQIEETNVVKQTASNPVLEEIRYLQFRYWSGTNWLDSWNAGGFPTGVEVSLGAEAQTNETDLVEYPGEIFRRVIYLAGTAASPTGLDLFSAKTGTNMAGAEAAP